MSEAFVTLSTNDTYCLGALVLAHSLRGVGTSRKLVILISPDVSEHMRSLLATVFDSVKLVDVIHSENEKILSIMKRPELGVTLTKLHCWKLTEYQKCVFMDADTLVLQNIDELFEREELSAVSDIGWPDCFNSGVFVFKPSDKTFDELIQLLGTEGTFDGGDQGLLNTYFSNWATEDISKHLSFIYNMSSIAVYSYPPAYKRFGHKVKVVHFLGNIKPWLYGYNKATNQIVEPYGIKNPQQLEHVQMWWNIFLTRVQPHLSTECQKTLLPFVNMTESGVASDLSSSSYSGMPLSKHEDQYSRKKNWEAGNVDYLGSDNFENIQKKLDVVIGK